MLYCTYTVTCCSIVLYYLDHTVVYYAYTMCYVPVYPMVVGGVFRGAGSFSCVSCSGVKKLNRTLGHPFLRCITHAMGCQL